MNRTLEHFSKICEIPRPSKREDRIREYLRTWAEHCGYASKEDAVGNLCVHVPATAGREGEFPVVLQAHMDMVCVKTPESSHDFDADPIVPVVENGWMRASGTTLGADNGIGIALALAACDFPSRPPLDLLFTVDEECGMSGALNFDASIVRGNRVVNLDSEDEGEICLSSAGGCGVTVERPLVRTPSEFPAFALRISGMRGGHSGVEIHENRGSAVECLFEILSNLGSANARIVSISGGTASNVIPSTAEAVVSASDPTALERVARETVAEWKRRFDCPGIRFEIEADSEAAEAFGPEAFEFVRIVRSVPTGVRSMSAKIEGLVQTSGNLGVVRTEGSAVSMTYHLRSSVPVELSDFVEAVRSAFEPSGCRVVSNDPYPGWQQDPESSFVRTLSDSVEAVLGSASKLTAVHAGLECGAIVGRLAEGAEAVSIGPTVVSPHTVEERCDVATVERAERILETFLAKLR